MNKNEAMINMLSQKLGITAQELKEAIEKNDFSSAIKNISPKDKEKLKAVLENKELVDKIMRSKEAKDLKNNF